MPAPGLPQYNHLIETLFVTSGDDAGRLKDNNIAWDQAQDTDEAFERWRTVRDQDFSAAAAGLNNDPGYQQLLEYKLRARIAAEGIREQGSFTLTGEDIIVLAVQAAVPLVRLAANELREIPYQVEDKLAAQNVLKSYEQLNRDVARRNARIVHGLA
jgi:hypothetical protein